MDAKQRLYFALGQLVCAIAKADGKMQREEQEELHELVRLESEKAGIDAEIVEIVYTLVGKDQRNDAVKMYNWAMNEMRAVSHIFTPELRQRFIRFCQMIADAFAPTTIEEQSLIDRFQADLETL